MLEHHAPIATRPITAAEVLASVQADHRLQSRWDPEVEPDAVLRFDTTVRDWRNACDLVAWRPLGRALNDDYGIALTDEEWRAVLEPAKARTLKDVCEAIAAGGGKIEVIEPVTVFGTPCMSAGAIQTIRRVLDEAGIAVDRVAPSSPLGPVLRRDLGVLRRLAMIAPGRLPDVTVKVHPVSVAVQTTFVISLLLTFAGVVCGLHALTILAGIPAIVSIIAMPITSRLGLSDVRIGELKDFRDLSYALIGSTAPPRRGVRRSVGEGARA